MKNKNLIGLILLLSLFNPIRSNAQDGAQVNIGAAIQSATPGTGANTFTGAQTITINALGTTSTDGLVIQNTTAATIGTTVQISPRSRWCGTAYNSVSTLSEINCFFIENLPITNAGTTTATWKLGYSLNGGAATYPLTVTSAGLLTMSGGGTFSGNVTGTNLIAGAGAQLLFGNRGTLSASVDGKFQLQMNDAAHGVTIDVTTDSIAKFNNRATNAYATVDSLAYQASGTAITSGTTHLSAGSGMAVANVGANSCGTTTATIAGNNNASVTTVGATAGTQCRIAFTFAATTEWDCAANDDTTTVAVRTTPIDTTHTDIIGTFTAGDKVTAICFPR